MRNREITSYNDSHFSHPCINNIPYGDPTYMGYTDIKELPKHIFDELKHFFSVYKQLESKKTDVKSIGGPIEAVAVIERAIENYKKKFCVEK